MMLPSESGSLLGTYRFGVFYDPRTRPVFVRRRKGDDRPLPRESDDVGFYLSFDQMLYRESPEDSQGLGVFARYGIRHGDVNRISQFWSVGAQYQGFLRNRDSDVLGFGAYSVHASDQYQRAFGSDFSRETGFELYYKFQITPWLTLTPDVQYIVNPSGLRNASDSIVMGFRARVSM
jgi:porin